MATLCLALKSIGNGHVTDEQKNVLRNFLNDYIQEHDIKSDLKLMPQWIQKMLNEIINKESLRGCICLKSVSINKNNVD